jgi:dTDP-4-dehydrorhamnose 3,5-epimerase
MHYQRAPFEEAKLVRCTRGALHDVIVDLRRNSASFGEHVAVALNESNGRMLYVPAGFAHGFVTLADATEVFYQMSTPYVPDSAAGLRYDDPALAIAWPEPVREISDRDLGYPPFDRAGFQP